MVNAAFKNRKDQQRERYEEAGRNSGFWTNMLSQNLRHVAHLHSLDDGLRLDLHFHMAGGVPRWMICSGMYINEDGSKEHCVKCEEPNKFDPSKNNYPQTYLCSMGFVLEDIGAKRISKKGTEYSINPLQVILTPLGKGEIYLENLTEAENDGSLLTEFWKYKRGEGGGFITPSQANLKTLSKQFNLKEVDTVREEFSQKPVPRIQSEIMSAFLNVKYTHTAIREMGIVPIDLDNVEEPDLDNE